MHVVDLGSDEITGTVGAVSSPGSRTRRMFRVGIRSGRETVTYVGSVEAVDSSRFDTLVAHGRGIYVRRLAIRAAAGSG